MIEPDHGQLSIVRQCELVAISRSGFYYQPAGETPLHLGHLRTMTALAEMGAAIVPPMPAFYAKPASIAEMVDQSVGRALDLFGLDWRPVRRWGRDIGPVADGDQGSAR